MGKSMQWICPLLVGLLCCATSNAKTVELRLPNKLVAMAEFRQGSPDKPAVILISGFLQTNSFPTISRLTDTLADEGYTVLAPTLTLGVTHRRQSLACEAINTHTVASGVQEIQAWVNWLKTKKAKHIVLSGHSLGSIYNLAYLSGKPDILVRQYIGVSIVEGSLKIGENARAPLVHKLRQQVRDEADGLVENQFSFCQKYRSTPESILSYMEWGPEKILTEINQSKIPVTMIMGSKDDRLGPDWTEKLKQTSAKVILIEGANHFMDGQYEFELYDHFLASVSTPKQ